MFLNIPHLSPENPFFYFIHFPNTLDFQSFFGFSGDFWGIFGNLFPFRLLNHAN